MILFITNPKYFSGKMIENKQIDLTFIFGSKKLFSSFKNNVVNIDIKGKVINENFFPENRLTIDPYKLLYIRQGIYAYFKKVEYQEKRKYYKMTRGFKDYQYNLVISLTRDMEKNGNINEALQFIDHEIFQTLIRTLELGRNAKTLEQESPYIRIVLNTYNTFFRSYVYHLGFDRGAEVFADIFKYSLFLKTIQYYKFNKYEIYKDRLHYSYIKVLCRLFIEKIHKNSIKDYIQWQINNI